MEKKAGGVCHSRERGCPQGCWLLFPAGEGSRVPVQGLPSTAAGAGGSYPSIRCCKYPRSGYFRLRQYVTPPVNSVLFPTHVQCPEIQLCARGSPFPGGHWRGCPWLCQPGDRTGWENSRAGCQSRAGKSNPTPAPKPHRGKETAEEAGVSASALDFAEQQGRGSAGCRSELAGGEFFPSVPMNSSFW